MRLSDFWKIELALGLFQMGRTFHETNLSLVSEVYEKFDVWLI